MQPWRLHGERRRRTNVGGVLLLGICGRHGLRIFCRCSVTAGGPATVVSHRLKTLQRALIARICASHNLVGASLSSHVSVCRPCRTRY